MCAGMMNQEAHDVMVPERAIAMADGVLFNVTGRGSPDILFFGSNLWCARCGTAFRDRAAPKPARESHTRSAITQPGRDAPAPMLRASALRTMAVVPRWLSLEVADARSDFRIMLLGMSNNRSIRTGGVRSSVACRG